MNNRILRLTYSAPLLVVAVSGTLLRSAQAQDQPPVPPTPPATPATAPPAPGQSATPQTVPPATAPAAAATTAPTTPARRRRQLPFERVPRPFRAQIGAAFPTGSRTRDDINSAVFYGGLSVDLGATRSTNPVYLGAYLDAVYGQNSENPPINRLVSAGLGIQFRTYLTESTSKTRYYAGAGIGAYVVSGKRDVLVDIPATIGDVTVSRLRYRANDSYQTTLGGKLFVGAEFDQRFFGEISFTGTGSSRGYSPTGPTASVGIRF